MRQPSEREVVADVLMRQLSQVTIRPEAMYAQMHREMSAALEAVRAQRGGDAAARATARRVDSTDSTVWMPSTVRLHSLVSHCMQHDEPILLVGETGTGKTTVCQLYAEAVT